MWRLLLVMILAAGYYLSTPFFKLAAGLFPSSLSVIPAAKIGTSLLVNLSWHAPISSEINSLSSVINSTGTYGFVFNSSILPDGVPYGIVLFLLLSKSGC